MSLKSFKIMNRYAMTALIAARYIESGINRFMRKGKLWWNPMSRHDFQVFKQHVVYSFWFSSWVFKSIKSRGSGGSGYVSNAVFALPAAYSLPGNKD